MRGTIISVAMLGAFVTASCRQGPQAYVSRANRLFDAGKTDEAILNYKKAIQRDAKFGEAYYRLALAELKITNAREAYAALVTADRLMPDRADVKVTLANLLLLSYARDKSRPAGFYAQLNKLSDELIKRDPRSYDGFRIKAYLAWSDGKLNDAEGFFAKANTAKPMTPDLVVSWVQVLFGDGKEAEAEQLARQLIQAHKNSGTIYDVLYGHYRFQKRLAEAENALKMKVTNNPGELDYELQLAAFYAGTGQREEMTGVIKSLLNDPKTFPMAHLKVGDFYAALHDWPEALDQYQQGAKADATNRTIYLKRVADAWLSQGKGEEAAGVVGEILKQNPSDQAAQAVSASLLLKSGKPDQVQTGVNELQGLVDKDPQNAPLRFALARALLVKGERERARVQFQELLKERPRHIPSILALAELSLGRKDYPQALRYANDALSVNPRLAAARLIRATVLAAQNNYTEARTELNSLATDVPQDLEVQFELATLDLAEKKYPQAEIRLEGLYGKQKLKALTGLVEVYRAQGQLDKAIARLKLELGKSPDTFPIHSLLAGTFVEAKKYDLAVEEYKKMQLMGAKSAQLDFRLGQAYQLEGDVGKAVASYQEARELAPLDPLITASLADAQRQAGRDAEAMMNYRRVLTLDAENANVMNNLAYTLLDTGGSADEAQKLVEHALQKSPRDPHFADTLGMVYLKKNLRDSAAQVFTGLTQRYPGDPVFRYHYALALFQEGQAAKARTQLELALRNNPPDGLRKDIQNSLAKIR